MSRKIGTEGLERKKRVYIVAAKCVHGVAEAIEFDDDPSVSLPEDAAEDLEDGAWVQAWIWVGREQMNERGFRCQYDDCPEAHAVATEDEEISCSTCRAALGLD